MTKGESDGQRVKLGSLLGELARLAQVHEKLTTAHKFHDEVDSLVVLEHELHANEEWMISLLQNLLLEHRRLNLVELKDGVLTQSLHCVQILRVLLLNQEDLTEATLTNDGLEVEILQCSSLLSGITHEDRLAAVLAHFLRLHLNFESHLRVHAGSDTRVLRLSSRSGRSLRLRCLLVINIFFVEAELGVRQNIISILSVLL